MHICTYKDKDVYICMYKDKDRNIEIENSNLWYKFLFLNKKTTTPHNCLDIQLCILGKISTCLYTPLFLQNIPTLAPPPALSVVPPTTRNQTG